MGKAQSKVKLDEALRNFNAEDLPTRLEGVEQLGHSDDEAKAVGYLLQAANDPEMAIRLKAIDVLGTMRAKDAVGSLVQQLFMRGTETTTKQHILVALGKIGDSRATKPILDFLARDGDRGLRGNAIFALGDIGDQDAVEPLTPHRRQRHRPDPAIAGADRGAQDPDQAGARGHPVGTRSRACAQGSRGQGESDALKRRRSRAAPRRPRRFFQGPSAGGRAGGSEDAPGGPR